MEVATNENTAGVTWFLKSRVLPICCIPLCSIYRTTNGYLPTKTIVHTVFRKNKQNNIEWHENHIFESGAKQKNRSWWILEETVSWRKGTSWIIFLIHQVALNSELPAGCECALGLEHALSSTTRNGCPIKITWNGVLHFFLASFVKKSYLPLKYLAAILFLPLKNFAKGCQSGTWLISKGTSHSIRINHKTSSIPWNTLLSKSTGLISKEGDLLIFLHDPNQTDMFSQMSIEKVCYQLNN